MNGGFDGWCFFPNLVPTAKWPNPPLKLDIYCYCEIMLAEAGNIAQSA